MGGLGAFTFRYAEGLSYFSADPRACVNCHIMRDEYASWQHSAHHAVATCVTCHLPHPFVPKYWAKAVNGWNHSKAFTLQDYPEHIRIWAEERADPSGELCGLPREHGVGARDAGAPPMRTQSSASSATGASDTAPETKEGLEMEPRPPEKKRWPAFVGIAVVRRWWRRGSPRCW